jgi:hypothetical protein
MTTTSNLPAEPVTGGSRPAETTGADASWDRALDAERDHLARAAATIAEAALRLQDSIDAGDWAAARRHAATIRAAGRAVGIDLEPGGTGARQRRQADVVSASLEAEIARAGRPASVIRQAIGMPERVWARKMAEGRWTVGDLGGIAQALGTRPSQLLPAAWRAARPDAEPTTISVGQA